MDDRKNHARLTRRTFLGAAVGALVVSFSLDPRVLFAQEAEGTPQLPGSLSDTPTLESWIRIGADGVIDVFTGKAELGQGIATAILQIAAEQLVVAPEAITIHTADTTETPNEGYTAGSNSMADSGTAILHAAAQVRNILRDWAGEDLGVEPASLTVSDGAVTGPNGQGLSFGEIVSGRSLSIAAELQSDLLSPERYRVMGQFVPRIDIPPKLTGEPYYVHDLRLENMAHARVARPPHYGARLTSLDAAEVEALPGFVRIVRNGSFLAVVMEKEYQAVVALRALQQAAQWEGVDELPQQSNVHDNLQTMPSEDNVVSEAGNGVLADRDYHSATYTRPYIMHGAIGPSCAVAQMDGPSMRIWTHSQGVYPLRATLANLLEMPEEEIACVHMDGSGCYGHNGADDVAADAALVAREMGGRPVRVLWMREDEHAWEPYGTAMVGRAGAALSEDGAIAGWTYEVWSHPHATRPGGSPNNLMPAWHVASAYGPPEGFNIPLPSGGADRNAVPTYAFPNTHITEHYVPEMPVRVSALRSLGAYLNVFASESFMDEMALRADADPVDFRLRHTDDPRATAVIERAAQEFGWAEMSDLPRGRGRGFGYARYETIDAYTAVALEVDVDTATGDVHVIRAVAADDSGDAVSPDGIRNQIEGGIIQSISWTLFEEVSFEPSGITSRDWSSYPILRFNSVPESVDVHVISRPGEPFLGTGEAAQGPTAAALGNAIADATGVRLRNLPLRPERVREALLATGAA